MIEEDWRPIPYNKGFFASNIGRIRGPRGKILKFYLEKNGYLTCQVKYRQKYTVHRLICMTFHGDPPFVGAQVSHENDVKTDNRSENLSWATYQQNVDNKVKNNRQAKGQGHGMAKLTEEAVADIRRRRATGEFVSSINRSYPHVSASAIYHVTLDRHWKQKDVADLDALDL